MGGKEFPGFVHGDAAGALLAAKTHDPVQGIPAALGLGRRSRALTGVPLRGILHPSSIPSLVTTRSIARSADAVPSSGESFGATSLHHAPAAVGASPQTLL